jgi:UDP-N-acetylmuramate--alanine ligase
MFDSKLLLHFTGIGGIGMSGLAVLWHEMGRPVSGSDLRSTPLTARLAAMGMRIAQGHAAENLPAEAAALVYTSALDGSNPEVAEARRRGLPLVHRGELLAEIMRRRDGVAVGGTHGKTTTASLLASIVLKAGLDPTVLVGTTAPWLDGLNARLGAGSVMISECDESDGSFLELSPSIAIITNIDREHVEHYGSFEGVCGAFVRFANHASLEGGVVACIDDPLVREMIPKVRRRVWSYGRSADAEFRITQESAGAASSGFAVCRRGVDLGGFTVNLPGGHNVLNATAALAAALELGAPADAARQALAEFSGIGRRMEWKGSEGGVTVIDDYGHHPTEVRATLAALRLRQPGRLYVLFQPHRFTRTRDLMEEFGAAFAGAEAVRVLDIYAASEPPIAGVTGAALARKIEESGHPDCRFTGSLEEAVMVAASEVRPGDLVLTLGAGSITEAGPKLLEALRNRSS